MFYEHIWTLVGLNVKIDHGINNVNDLTAALSINQTLSQMMSSGVTPGPCGQKFSPYIKRKQAGNNRYKRVLSSG